MVLATSGKLGGVRCCEAGLFALKRARGDPNQLEKSVQNPIFWLGKNPDEKPTGNENRTHTPPTPHHHRAFDDGAAAPSTRASPADALRITFHIKPMAHV